MLVFQCHAAARSKTNLENQDFSFFSTRHFWEMVFFASDPSDKLHSDGFGTRFLDQILCVIKENEV